MGEETSTSTSTSTSSEEISAPKIIAFIALLILVQESALTFIGGVIFQDFLFGILGIILAIVIFISLKFIDLGPVKVPYYWWLTLIFGVLFVVLGWLTTPGVAGTFGATRPYLGGVLLILAGITEILAEKKNIVYSKFVAIVGAGFAIYESFNLFILYTALPVAANAFLILNGIVGIIAAAILIILVLDKIDIKIPYEWWVVLLLAFIVFTWVSAFFAGIGGIVLMIAFLLLILGH
ncbi:hypothetical protein LCGC14_1737710 [marine sediment metagenome]|uniref:Uncharacterized protein n=1 Tax=marine sediment metagenome TaxID=412755 RepID=A0A0F9H7N9_9ZZZZ|nr:MAG: hypothetical protein Lokiarch_52180 [Candidatus Lokiarchaeum sp. GC14_75]